MVLRGSARAAEQLGELGRCIRALGQRIAGDTANGAQFPGIVLGLWLQRGLFRELLECRIARQSGTVFRQPRSEHEQGWLLAAALAPQRNLVCLGG